MGNSPIPPTLPTSEPLCHFPPSALPPSALPLLLNLCHINISQRLLEEMMSKPIANALGVMAAIAAIANLAWACPARSAAPRNYPQGARTLASSDSIAGFRDVSPSDPYFLALKNLVEEYGLDNLGFSDGCRPVFDHRTFRGDLPLKRGDFVIYFDRGIKGFQDKMQEIDREAAERVAEQMESLSLQAERELKEFDKFSSRLAAARDAVQALEAEIAPKTLADGKKSKSTRQSVRPAPLMAEISSRSQVTDVSADAPYYQALQEAIYLYRLNIVRADGRFEGDKFITRGEFALYFNELLEIMKVLVASDQENYYQQKLYELRSNIEINRILDLFNGWERLEAVEEKLERLANGAKQKIALEKIGADKVSESQYAGNQGFLLNFNAIAWVTSVSQVSDVSPGDPYFPALKNLIDRYEIDSVLRSDGTFQGDASLTRGDFIISLVEFANLLRNSIISPSLPPISIGQIVRKAEETLVDLEARVASMEAALRE
ncbi:MAG: S-layer homology domain-containing protein [Oscillatoria sp. SIO1A7]|nr:S-layer homology domain-containing protein [Oscillatoria sp. SIO1A7]